MASEAKLDRFDPFVPREPWVNPWQSDGTYRVDFELLETLLGVAVGTSQRSGVIAGASDVWAAEELRRAGFDPDEVWPRRSRPRVLPRDVRNFVDLALTKKLRDQVEPRFEMPGARKALPAEAHVMGRAYSKQSDVVIASWAAGVELLISTKTMLSSYQKNLRNRFEEGYGDAKNLRGRHPMAALGFLFIAGADIPPSSLEFAIDMLRKLTSEADVYDCACLLIIDGAQGAEEEDDGDERAVDDEPSALRNFDEGDGGEDQDETEAPVEGGAEAEPAEQDDRRAASVAVLRDLVPPDLGADHFFEVLITAALGRMPVAVYPTVRTRRTEVLEER